ncbi:MAG: hypothetical protein AMXMBFR64_10870 [Myxococcales bacterium]
MKRWWVALLLAGCGDLYSSQHIPLREYATIELEPACVEADGQPWLLTGTAELGRPGFVQRVLWDDLDLEVQAWQASCEDLLRGTVPVASDTLEVCFVVVAALDAAAGDRDLTVYLEAGDGLIVATATLGVRADCGAP